MNGVRDVPPVAGAIIWARQIERQLAGYMKRVEDVLGRGWEHYAEGQKLAGESSSFQKKLDTRPIFDAWLSEAQKKERETKIGGRLFEIVRTRQLNGSTNVTSNDGAIQQVLQLAVNFDQTLVQMFKEVRNMLWLGFSIPHTVSQLARDVRRIYPFAVAINEVLRTYSKTCDEIDKATNRGTSSLLAGYKKDVQSAISRGMTLQWDGFGSGIELSVAMSDRDVGRHIGFVREFAGVVSVFQEKAMHAIDVNQVTRQLLDELRTCSFSRSSFAAILEKVQKHVDDLNLEGYSNLDDWVRMINDSIRSTLGQRLQSALKSWIAEFGRDGADEAELEQAWSSTSARRRHARQSTTDLMASRSALVNETPTLTVLVHEIKIKNQAMFLDPPMEVARERIYQQLHGWLATICTLPTVQSSRYELGLDLESDKGHSTYADVVGG